MKTVEFLLIIWDTVSKKKEAIVWDSTHDKYQLFEFLRKNQNVTVVNQHMNFELQCKKK